MFDRTWAGYVTAEGCLQRRNSGITMYTRVSHCDLHLSVKTASDLPPPPPIEGIKMFPSRKKYTKNSNYLTNTVI